MAISSNRNVEQIINAVFYAALLDHQENVPDYDYDRNSGPALQRRLDLTRFRPDPRKGDPKKYRDMYATFRFLIATDGKVDGQ